MKRIFTLQRTSLAYVDVPESAWRIVRAYTRFDRAYAALQRELGSAHPQPGIGWTHHARLIDSATSHEVEAHEIYDYQYAQLRGVPRSHISAEYSIGGGSGSHAVTVLGS